MWIAILGFGEQGRSAYEYWNKDGNILTICDEDEAAAAPSGAAARLGPGYLKNLDEFDLIVRSPSVHPRDIVAANSAAILDRVTTNTNEFFQVCPSKNIIGVTGTKGKGTTCALVAEILKQSGKKVHLGGNIGTPPLDMLKDSIQHDDYVVLELANFQLIDLKYSPPTAICLMVVPEHLDWHTDTNEYVNAKQQLFRWQTADDIAVYFSDSEASRRVVSVSHGRKFPYFQTPGAIVKENYITIGDNQICRLDELKLLGEHNHQNVCAAVTAVWFSLSEVTGQKPKPAAIKRALTSFSGLPHRLEFVREVDGVKFYDDSFGTTPETAMVAIKAFKRPKVLILGGSDKGADFTELAKAVTAGNVRQVVTIGMMGPKIASALEAIGYHNIVAGGATMDEIVKTARAQAVAGDVVLLSTACASFDMFKNYKERAAAFQQAVSAL